MLPPDYVLGDTLHAGDNSRVVRAIDPTGRAVVVKGFVDAYPRPEDLARLEREFELGRLCACPELVEHIRLVPVEDSLVMVVADDGARSIAQLIREEAPLPLERVLLLAERMARALGALHDGEVVHKDISPGNVLVGPDDRVWICDLGLASRVPRTTQSVCSPAFLEGTLAYISPEQTGRMNRSIDHRSDLYSLGATLFELLTGSLVFETLDAMELLHAHIAVSPPRASRLRPDVPPALDGILLRLLEKTAEHRYQSAAGLAADLRRCLDEVMAGENPSFAPGQRDVSRVFRVSGHLYGRDSELSALLGAFARVANGGTELLLVRGFSGIGKSMLVHEVHKPILERRGWFLDGKFDQLARANPLSALRQALSDLVRQLLTGSEASVAAWAATLSKALEGQTGVLVEFLPELAHLFPEPPPVLELAPTEARDRFDRLLVAFVQAFAGRDNPLVLFLDDLQWIDPASQRVLTALITSPESRHLLLIGAYRDNEVDASHPLLGAVNTIRERQVPVSAIDLGPLALQDVMELVTDSLGGSAGHETGASLRGISDPAQVMRGCQLIHQKTGGNPFFVTQFLQALAEQGMLANLEGVWVWSLDRIGRMDAIHTAVELMLDKIGRYSPDSRELLQLGATLGNTFDLATLSAISGSPPEVVVQGLWQAVKDGLLLAVDDGWQDFAYGDRRSTPADRVRFRFAHDRIQEAALASIPKEQLESLALRIGRTLLADKERLEERLFDVVNHLNAGMWLMETDEERHELAALNLAAGRHARKATAYGESRDYLTRGIGLLGDGGWASHYDLMFSLHRERIELEFLNGDLERARAIFDITKERVINRAQAGDIYQLMIRISLTAGEIAVGMKQGQECLVLFDIELPDDPDAAAQMQQQERELIGELIGERTVRSLVDLPVMDNPELEQALGLLHETWTCAVMAGDFQQVISTSLKLVRLSLEHGNCKFSACGYVAHAMVLSLTGSYASARNFGLLSMDVCHKWNDVFIIPKVHNTFANFTNHWVQPLHTNVGIYEESYANCQLSGDTWWGAWAAGWLRTTRFIKGDPLAELLSVSHSYHEYIDASGYTPLVWMSELDRNIFRTLLGRGESPFTLSSAHMGEEVIEGALKEMEFGFGLYLVYLYKAFVNFLHGRPEAAVPLIALAEENRDHIPGLMPYPDFWFYSVLVWAAEGINLDRIRDFTAQMEAWSEVCPENFQHRYLLMLAEQTRMEGGDPGALFEQAIAAAREHGYIQNAAIACERAARWHLAQGRRPAAVGYLADAHHLFRRWGAKVKVELLEAEFPDTLAKARARGQRSFRQSTSRQLATNAMDMEGVLRAAATLSGELVLDRLLENLVRLGMQIAGAERAVLVINDEGVLRVEGLGDERGIAVGLNLALADSDDLPRSIVQFVHRTKETVVLDDAQQHAVYARDPYVVEHGTRSVLCVPSTNQGQGVGCLYLEHTHATAAFTPERVKPLQLLSTQAAIAIDNARLYETMEQKVRDRTQQLAEKNDEILKAQSQLVQSEKMASLGQLVAGVAHEINNPINFIHSGLPSLKRDVEKLAGMVPEGVRDRKYDKVSDRIQRLLEAIGEGTRRTADIVRDLRTFSRLDEAEVKLADLREALDSTITLARNKRGEAEIVTDYAEQVPAVECFIGQLNQVFMNLMVNAFQAIKGPGTVTVGLHPVGDDRIQISIADTGCGMDALTRSRIFDPFFTTKDVGEGTGLGLSISHSIVVEKHKGQLEVDSVPGVGTTFRIILPLKSHEEVA